MEVPPWTPVAFPVDSNNRIKIELTWQTWANVNNIAHLKSQKASK